MAVDLAIAPLPTPPDSSAATTSATTMGSASLRTSAHRDTLALRRVFETTQAESCPTSYNFHMHTVCSDGRLQPETLIQQAVEIGLKGLAITDHHSIRGFRRAQAWLLEKTTQSPQMHLPHLWSGLEVTSQLLDTEVHILGYGFDPDSPVLQTYLQGTSPQGEAAQAKQVIANFHQAGALVVLAHPVRYRKPPEELIPEAAQLGIDGVETYYCYDNPNPWRTSPRQTEQVQRLSSTYGLLNTCGTDTHGLSLLQRL
jgi:predicted metal-dependent phosphoesterase TrpH